MDKKEYVKEYNKQYKLKNKEILKEKNKQYRIDNKEIIKEKKREYRNNNKPYQKQYHIQYCKTEKGKKSNTLSTWKFNGLISDNYEEIYDRYINCNNCEECNCEFSTKGDGVGKFKVMDHDHITGLFRNILCNNCNLNRH